MPEHTITLNKTEQTLCKFVATKRYENNRAVGTTNSKLGDQTDEQTDLEGIGGEVAFCSLKNVYPDLSIDARSASKGEDTYDAIVQDKTVDVKTTRYENGRLLAVPWKGESDPPHCYALMTGTFPTYCFRGYMLGIELLNRDRLGNLGHGMTYIARQSELVFEIPE